MTTSSAASMAATATAAADPPSSPRTTVAGLAIGIALGLAAALLWGGAAVVSRHLITTTLPAADLALLRYLGCFPVALAAVSIWRQRLWPRIPAAQMAVLLLLGGPPYHFLVIAGYGFASAGAGSLLVCGLMPLFALALAAALRTQPISGYAIAGVIAACIGLVIFASAGGRTIEVTATGLAIFASAALLWALLNLAVKSWKVDALQLTVALALWSPLFMPLWLLAPTEGSSLMAAPLADIVLMVVYHGWLVAFGATLLFFLSVQRLGGPLAGILQTANPAFAAGLGALLLGETLQTGHVLGAAVTVIGIILTIVGSTLASRALPTVERAVAGKGS